MSVNSKIEKYVFGHISAVVWSAVLAVGGLVFLGYFAHIEYMPVLDLSSSAAIIAAAAVSALVIVPVLAGVFIFAGVFWAGTNQGTALALLWKDSAGDYTVQGSVFWFMVPILVVAISVGVGATLHFSIGGGLLLLAICVSGLLARRRLTAISLKDFAGAFSWFWFTIFMSAMFLALPLGLVFMMAGSSSGDDLVDAWISASLLCVLVLMTNVFAVAKPKSLNPILWYAGIGFVVLIIVLAQFGRVGFVVSRPLQLFKFGSIEGASLVLSKDGCVAILELNLINMESDKDICVLPTIKILSRLGAEFYLEGRRLDGVLIRFSIPSDLVRTWSISVDEGLSAGGK